MMQWTIGEMHQHPWLPDFSILYETSDTWNTTGTGSVPCLDESQATIIAGKILHRTERHFEIISLQSPWINS